MSSILRAKNLSKVYVLAKDNIVRALDNVDVEIARGERVAIMGPSGSGKSTLLHMIGLLDRPDEGEIVIDDHNTSDLDNNEIAKIRRKKIGFVFQNFNLLPRWSAMKNVMLPAIYAKEKRRQATTNAKNLLGRVGLGNRIGHKPNELSGGEKQRVAIARALMNDPSIILADEPTGNLDSKSGEGIMKLFLELNREGKTMIVVTHDPLVAKRMERVIRLKDGKVIH